MSTFLDDPPLLAGTGDLPGEAAASTPSLPSSRLPLAGGLLFAVVAEAFLALALAFSSGTHLQVVELGVPLISGLFALGSCLLASMALRGRERGAWALMGVACIGVLVAQTARFVPSATIANLPLSLAGSYPSVASIALIAQSVGFFLAFLLFPPSTRGTALWTRLGRLFDGVLAVGAGLVAVIYFVLVPLAQTGTGVLTAGQMTTLAVCAGDLLLLGGLTFALRSTGARQNPLYGALGILGLAMLLLICADFASIVQTPGQLAPDDSPLQALWNAAYLGIGLGAMLRLRGGSRHSSAGEEAGAQEEGSGIWLALPFALTIVVAVIIIARAGTGAANSEEMLVAMVCASLLVGLIGVRHLVGLAEAHQLAGQRKALKSGIALAQEQVDQLRSSQLAQARARRESLEYLLDTLGRFGYGEYQARVGAVEHELRPLAEQLNILLDGLDRQLNDRDRGRETYLIRILTDALGRLALGELHDLPELPPPGGSALDGLMMSVVQVRTRLLNLQATAQQYEDHHYEAQQQLEEARQQLEQDAQTQRQAALEMTQSLEGQLFSERQVAQATEEQWQRERQRLQTQAQSAEERALAAEARVGEIEGMLQAAEQRLVDERLKTEQRLVAERQALEKRLREIPAADPARLASVREHSERLVSKFTSQAERLHAAAATIQTAAEVAHRLARAIQETAALPEIQGAGARGAAENAGARRPQAPAAEGAGQASSAEVSQPLPAPQSAKTLSAMQMLERMAGLRGDTTPRLPATAQASAPVAAGVTGKLSSGPLDDSAQERVARRLRTAAARAEEIAGGLLELAQQCIQAGEESMRAAEEAGTLSADLEAPSVPSVIRRTVLPARTPKSAR